MLVLSRRRGEAIRIGPEITVTVTRICRGRVSLAIDAPRQVPIVRDELSDLANRIIELPPEETAEAAA
jgi:carbon storage regulator